MSLHRLLILLVVIMPLAAFLPSAYAASGDGDQDKDGVADYLDNCLDVFNPYQDDMDKDGIGDACDSCDDRDFDQDGVVNCKDQCPDDYGPESNNGCPEQAPPDYDQDGIPDAQDNCPDVYNKDQYDSDSDGLGDACDPCDGRDFDADGLINCKDQCPDDYGPEGNGGCPEQAAPDYDKDGVPDVEDNCPKIYNPDQADMDKDLVGDACDGCDNRDHDSDGVIDCQDKCPDTYGPASNSGCPVSTPPPATNTTPPFNITTTVLPPSGTVPVENGTQICRQISGKIVDFPYPAASIRLKIVRMDSTRWARAPFKSNPFSYTLLENYTEYPTRPGTSANLTYLSRCITSGLWLVYPEFNPIGEPCEWAKTWNVPYRLVDLTRNYTIGNVDFIYMHDDMSMPVISINVSPSSPISTTRFNATATGADPDSGILNTSIMVRRLNGSVLGARSCDTGTCMLSAGPLMDVEIAEVVATASDSAGNICSASRRLELSSCYNLVQDGTETGSDCGGRCSPCIPCTWCNSNITPLVIHGRPDQGYIDVIFFAGHDYTVRNHTFSEFVQDARNVVTAGLYKLDTITDPPIALDFKSRYNFYYWNTAINVDTRESCAWPVPRNFWESAPFADNALILDIQLMGGCCDHVSPHTLCHAPGRWDQEMYDLMVRRAPSFPYDARTPLGIALHEEGHGIFGLVDTYCGPTWYGQHDPDSNVWSSLANCQRDTSAQGWGADKGQCRQIVGDYSFQSCSKPYYSFDMVNNQTLDLMHTANPPFGVAGTRRILWTFEQLGGTR